MALQRSSSRQEKRPPFPLRTVHFPPNRSRLVPQATIDDVVKKSLEPVVLSLLDKPISGYDIVHEIHNRYNVLIPQARIYTYLYDLENKGYLAMKTSGKSKLYSPTESGKKYIHNRLNEFKFVFRHILGDRTLCRSHPPKRGNFLFLLTGKGFGSCGSMRGKDMFQNLKQPL